MIFFVGVVSLVIIFGIFLYDEKFSVGNFPAFDGNELIGKRPGISGIVQ